MNNFVPKTMKPANVSGNEPGNNGKPKRQWRKVLYERQPYPDNYIDTEKFLEDLVLTKMPQPFSYRSMLLGASIIVQQMTIVVGFLTIYKYIMIRSINVARIVVLDMVALVLIYSTHFILSEKQQTDLFKSIKSAILFAVCLRIAAPVIQTLTSSFSDDTIHALAISLSFIHLIFHDYSYINCDSDHFCGTLSLNAAMFTVVLLASRLHQIEMVFAFVLLAIVCFSLFPQTARIIKKRSSWLHLLVISFKWFGTSLLLFSLDKTLFSIYQFLIGLLLIVCPIWLMKMQLYKKSLSGPWDIAIL